MYTDFLAFLPNLLAGVLIAYLGFVIAKVASNFVEALGRGLDTLSTRMGLGEKIKLSRLMGQIVFLILFVPILIAALDALRLEAISRPATEMLATLMAAIPQIMAAAIILTVAYVGGRFVMIAISDILENLGANELPHKIGISGLFTAPSTFSRFCGGLAFFFIMLTATVSAVEKLAMPQISSVLSSLLVFAGNVVLGLIILGVGSIIANLAHDALRKTSENEFLASIARFAILGLVRAMGLDAMNIADNIVSMALGLTLGAVAVAVAVSFGLGGKDDAS